MSMEAVRESTTAKWEIHYGGINHRIITVIAIFRPMINVWGSVTPLTPFFSAFDSRQTYQKAFPALTPK